MISSTLLTVFEEDDSQQYHLCGKSPDDTLEWMEKIKNSRYSCVALHVSTSKILHVSLKTFDLFYNHDYIEDIIKK